VLDPGHELGVVSPGAGEPAGLALEHVALHLGLDLALAGRPLLRGQALDPA